MLCSALELQLSDDHDGIIDLPADAPVGKPYAEWAGLDDPVIEINLTPNRPDCTGVHGIARDLAAADIGTLMNGRRQADQGRVPLPGRRASSTSAPRRRSARLSRCGWSRASRTARRPNGCSAG